MANNYFSFKQFTINQDQCALRVSTDSCILGAWLASKHQAAQKLLDIGAGTGLLMLMFAQKSAAEIHGIEIEPSCFSQLEDNIANSPFTERCKAIKGDVRSYQFQDQYECIVSNPPFYDRQLVAGEGKKDMARHSTHLDLPALFRVVSNVLMDHGKFTVLLPYSRLQEAMETGTFFGLYCSSVLNIRHTSNHDYFRTILQFEKIRSVEDDHQELVIRNSDGGYSNEFTVLLKDYYLNL